ncbi:MAG: hypothetical protein KKD77_21590, partial [Gammaproteobacteria bacterium]|nr:hypothetical protein [Gammaproteobacteria bacterium]
IDYLLEGNEATNEITDKAIAHAKERLSKGESPFAESVSKFREVSGIELDQPSEAGYEATQPQDYDPEWMQKNPFLAGLYGAGKGVLEQAIAPAIDATATLAGAVLGTPIIGGALGYGIGRQTSDYLIDQYKRLGGENPEVPTITEELLQSAGDVGSAIVIGHAFNLAGKGMPYATEYLFETLPKRLYGSAIKTPLSKKWIQTLPGKEISKRTAAIEEGIRMKVPPSEYGVQRAKFLEEEVKTYIDDITAELSNDPKNLIDVNKVLQKGLERAYAKASNSSDPVGAKEYVDLFKSRFQAHGKDLTSSKANAIKRQLYQEVKWGVDEAKGVSSILSTSSKKGVSREIMLNLEEQYPALRELNATDSARVGLAEAIERSYAKQSQTNLVPLGSKILLRPHMWPLSLWEATVGHPQVKAKLAFALSRANPSKFGKTDYPGKPPGYKPPKEGPKGEPDKGVYRYEPPFEQNKAPLPPKLPEVKSPPLPEIKGTYTPEQLNKMLGSQDITKRDMAIQDIIDTRGKIAITEGERVQTVSEMLKNIVKKAKEPVQGERGSMSLKNVEKKTLVPKGSMKFQN